MKKVLISLAMVLAVVLASCGKEEEPKEKYVIYTGEVYQNGASGDTSVSVNNLETEDGKKVEGPVELQSISKIENKKDERSLNVADLKVGDKVDVYLKSGFEVEESSPERIAYKYIIKIVKS